MSLTLVQIMPETLPDSLLDDDEAYETHASDATITSIATTHRSHCRTASELSGVSDTPSSGASVAAAPHRSTGAGVILLAQRLLGSPDKST